MTAPPIGPSSTSQTYRHSSDSLGESQQTRTRMIRSMQSLEHALAMATYTRESKWRNHVVRTLKRLHDSMTAQASELRGESGLLAELILETPRLSSRINRLREDYDQLVKRIDALHSEFSAEETRKTMPNIADMRERIAELITDLRKFQSEETDLIYEAIQVDIGAAD